MPSPFMHFSDFGTGELAGATSATQMPEIDCRMVCFKAVASNAGNVYVGKSGVTKVAGTTTTTAGWELDASQETPWIPCGNLSEFYRICDNAGDDLVYFYLT